MDKDFMASTVLSGIRVLDLTRVRSGPTAVRQLADWGADVIKIEIPVNLEADGALGASRDSPDFQNLHRNKRSLTLNLKDEEGISVFKKLVQNSDVVVESSKKFGSQCIVVAIDAKKNGNIWEIFTHGGRNKTDIDAIEFAKKMEESGAGELLVTSMDRDGTQVGYDIELMSKISSKVNIPVIASGGVGSLDHLVDGIKLGNASAVLAASIFHYGKYSVKEAKEYLDSKGIPVRI